MPKHRRACDCPVGPACPTRRLAVHAHDSAPPAALRWRVLGRTKSVCECRLYHRKPPSSLREPEWQLRVASTHWRWRNASLTADLVGTAGERCRTDIPKPTSKRQQWPTDSPSARADAANVALKSYSDPMDETGRLIELANGRLRTHQSAKPDSRTDRVDLDHVEIHQGHQSILSDADARHCDLLKEMR
ncbi:hypothetical protein BURKHO8Y_70086 [Burkholderia sp. 8Y]|nr:hypothetical protein BURKHO8Y_70086 [Burkholderia sp. 8Y]